MMIEIVRKWHAADLRLAERRNLPFGYVIHQAGLPPKDFDRKVREVLARSGVGKSAHKCKHGGVTLLAYCGCTVEELAEYFGNAENTLRKYYLHVNWDKVQRKVSERIAPNELRWKNLRDVSTKLLAQLAGPRPRGATRGRSQTSEAA
jgi:hypothetical protein